eukprot:TRINITY_DN13064_c0_g1_i1.p1 TRINITY_DN13064_c0_g1~~TRINITY_DN13064_c0_g1_i1.p1  ORF type:complete len:848 (-),score=201.58 TRINITY_DN13064_c0_g1_i1:376-2574(-)
MSTHLCMKDELICSQGERQECVIVVLEGNVGCYTRSDEGLRETLATTRGIGCVIDDTAVLWATPRPYTIRATEDNVILAKLTRESYMNLSIRFKFLHRGAYQDMIQNAKLLEMMNEEQTAALTDVLKIRFYEAGQHIIRHGDEGKEMFFVDDGEARVWVKTGPGLHDEKEFCRHHRGDLFGEWALLKNAPRAANVTAVTKVRVLILGRRQFERILGPMDKLQEAQYNADPRKIIADFYSDGDSRGPLGSLLHRGHDPAKKVGDVSKWFVVYRPTSRDAIRKMLNGSGVGKGLNVKGKSAKQGVLSGYVPFCQVSDNKHKPLIEQSPPHARTKIYYKSKASREEARQKLEATMASPNLRIEHRRIDVLDEFISSPSPVFGLDVPEAVIREAYIMKPDLSPVLGWETGRRSEPFSMDMNLHGVRGETGKEPEVVLYQFDPSDVMNPRGVLIAYAEQQVKPVVSDFDTFTVASIGQTYEPVPEEQAKLILWGLDHTEKVLSTPDHNNWTSRWIEIMRMENERGFHPHLPKFGFGDPTSYEMTGEVVKRTEACGAVRHGAECFNYAFPQELDDEFLVVWTQFLAKPFSYSKPWAYFTEDKLREFLLDRVSDGFAFPINPTWPVRDKGWFKVLEALEKSSEGQKTLPSWYLPHLKITERIKGIHAQFPECFKQQAKEAEKVETDEPRKTTASGEKSSDDNDAIKVEAPQEVVPKAPPKKSLMQKLFSCASKNKAAQR